MGASNPAADDSAPNDLTKFLAHWPYEAGKINVRLVSGHDGEPRIQLRLDLGVLQMRVSGRPDGTRPNGYESMLEYQETRLDEQVVSRGSAADFVLSEDECRELREEALQFYHRYVCLMVLEDFEGVVRDTTRNIRVLDLCAKYAETESDRSVLEQVRPYILMMRTRALASQAMADNEPKAAMHAINEGLNALRDYYADNELLGTFDQSTEVRVLKGMKDALTPKLPVSQKAELRQRLQAALTQENYELAAILRDELKILKD